MPIRKPELEVTIDTLSNSGDGVARVEERVLFVPFTAPGDRVRVQVTKDRKSFMIARLLEVISPGPSRIQPKCQHFRRCGGCDWQHLDYQTQTDAKGTQLRETLQRIGGLENAPIAPLVLQDPPFNYRNRIQGEIRRGQFSMHQKVTGAPIAIKRCEIADELINTLLDQSLDHARQGRVELAVVNGEAKIVSLQDKRTSELGFRQVNDVIAQKLMTELLKLVGESDCSRILDLYCGRGEWTARIAAALPDSTVIGIDSLQDNITAANAQRKKMNLSNLTFQRATVESQLPKLELQGSLCIVDPPRAGLAAELVEALQRNRPSVLIYVSCHPATLARDLKALTGSAYQLESIQPFDMFPQTSHLETLVLLHG